MSKDDWFFPSQKEAKEFLENRDTEGTSRLYQYSQGNRLDLYDQTVTANRVYEKFLDRHTGGMLIVEYRQYPNGNVEWDFYEQS